MSVPDASRVTRYLTLIVRWLATAGVVFVLTILAGNYIVDHFVDKVYSATAEIEMRVVSWGGPHGDGTDDPIKVQAEFLSAQLSLIQSSDTLLPVIYDLGLDKAWAKRVDQSDSDALPPLDALLPQDALAEMNKILKLDVLRGTNLVDITVSEDSPTECAAIANAIAERYKEMRDEEEAARSQRGLDAVRDQIAQQQKVVDEARDKVEKIEDRQSPLYQAAQHDLESQQSLLAAYKLHLSECQDDDKLRVSPVRIISRAEVPTETTRPNKRFDFVVTVVAAFFLSLSAASFVEIVLLFLRAAERTEN